MNYSVIVLCAGSGTRTGLGYNKMLYKKNDQTVYEMTMNKFLGDSRCKQIIVVCKKEEEEIFNKYFNDSRIQYVTGGKERQDSVYNGLEVVNQDYVLIHDGARPYVSQDNINDLLTCLKENDACLLMVPVKDTIKEVNEEGVVKTLVRSSLMQAQTPQAFKTSVVKDAYQKGKDSNAVVSDDASLVEMFGECTVKVVMGSYDNIKITTREDL